MAVTFEQVGALFSFAQVTLCWSAAAYAYSLRPTSTAKRLFALSLAIWGAAQVAGLFDLFLDIPDEVAYWFFVDMAALHALALVAFASTWPSRPRLASVHGALLGFALAVAIAQLVAVTVLRDAMRGAALGDLVFWLRFLAEVGVVASILLRLPELPAAERRWGGAIAFAVAGSVFALPSGVLVGSVRRFLDEGAFLPQYQDFLLGPGVGAAKVALFLSGYVAAPLLLLAWWLRERSPIVPLALAYGVAPVYLEGTNANFFLLATVLQAVVALVALTRGRAFGVASPPRERALLLSAIAGGSVFLVVVAVALGVAGDSALTLAAGSAAGAVLGGAAVYFTLPGGALVAADDTAEATRRLGAYTLALERELRAGRSPDEAHETLRELREALGVSPEAHATIAGRAAGEGGLLLGRYRPLRTLGEGGSGVTRLCVDERVGREVVLKSIRGDDPSPERVDALLREARAVGRIKHPHVVMLHDVVQSGREAVIVMEHAEGGSLASALRAGPLPPDAWRRVALGLLRALEAVHAAGIVHRDVKPSNVLLDAAGEPKLADFGIARVPGFETTVGGLREGAVGTFRYMAPEQAKGRPATPRSDLFSAGATLYEALVGEAYLAARPGESAVEVQLRAASAGAFDRDAPPRLRAWFARALDPDASARFSSAREMREALEQALA